MKLRLLLSLSLVLLAWPAAYGQTANDYFHSGAVNYLSNNVAKALEVVTNGLALFPDDIKLKKLEELLKQQSQQQQQQQQKDEQQKQQEQQQSQKDQQQKQEEQKSQSGKDQEKKDQQSAQSQQEKEQQAKEEAQAKAAQAQAGQMTPQQARQLLDAQKAEEAMIPIKPEEKPASANRRFKDW